MNEKNLWNSFLETGSIEDYLNYKNGEKAPLKDVEQKENEYNDKLRSGKDKKYR